MPSGIYKHKPWQGFQKGQKLYKHKNSNCGCFRCTGIPYNKGKHVDTSHLKQYQFKKGHISWLKGTKGLAKGFTGRHTLETKLKMSLAKKGKKLSQETKTKMSRRPKEFFKRISLLGIQKQQNSKEPTSIEKIVYDFLKSKGILFEKQKLINGKFLVDVYIPVINTIIEVDGNYWHSLDRVKKKDKAENAYLNKCGFNLIRLSETEINSGEFQERLVN